MLNKAVCKRCYKKYGVNWTGKEGSAFWANEAWEKGFVRCPKRAVEGVSRLVTVSKHFIDATPNHCPFILEHTVSKK